MYTIKHQNILRDALCNLEASSGASPDYARGILVGVVSAIMATGESFTGACDIVRRHFSRYIISEIPDEAIPETWRDVLPVVKKEKA